MYLHIPVGDQDELSFFRVFMIESLNLRNEDLEGVAFGRQVGFLQAVLILETVEKGNQSNFSLFQDPLAFHLHILCELVAKVRFFLGFLEVGNGLELHLMEDLHESIRTLSNSS